MPSWLLSETSWYVTFTTNPAPSILERAALSLSPTTPGTLPLGATPVLTSMVTRDPRIALAPAAGVWVTTVSLGSTASTMDTKGVKFASVSTLTASACVRPTTFGTFPPVSCIGGGKPLIGIPATALIMKSCQMGAASTPPNAAPPPRTRSDDISYAFFE
jgi:hypothetical protein